jgi:hypothetical protein
VSDHGLFVAGIVRQVCPKADIRLVRTLGKYGVSDYYGEILGRVPGLVPVLDSIHQPLRVLIDRLVAYGVLIVAAAGNDALPGNPRPLPRHPARYDNVLSVAALDRSGKATEYSNQASDAPPAAGGGNGIAIFGGGATLNRSPFGPTGALGGAATTGRLPTPAASSSGPLFDPRRVPVALPVDPRRLDAIVGLFTARFFPLSHYPNPHAGSPFPGNTPLLNTYWRVAAMDHCTRHVTSSHLS